MKNGSPTGPPSRMLKTSLFDSDGKETKFSKMRTKKWNDCMDSGVYETCPFNRSGSCGHECCGEEE